jgi:hypothetical protein
MKLEPLVCELAASKAHEAGLWDAIKTGATVDASKDRVTIVLKDGRGFSVSRKGHHDYKAHGTIKPFAKQDLTNLGEQFIKWFRKSVTR